MKPAAGALFARGAGVRATPETAGAPLTGNPGPDAGNHLNAANPPLPGIAARTDSPRLPAPSTETRSGAHSQAPSTIDLPLGDNEYIIAEKHHSGVVPAGLRAGDLVKSVNGNAVGSIDSDRLRFDEAAASGHAPDEGDGRGIAMSFPLP